MVIGASCTVDNRSHATAGAQTLGTVSRPAREPARVAAASTAGVADRRPACAARGGICRYAVGSMVRCSAGRSSFVAVCGERRSRLFYQGISAAVKLSALVAGMPVVAVQSDVGHYILSRVAASIRMPRERNADGT